MLSSKIQDAYRRVVTKGENIAVKMQTSDIVHATNEVLDMVILNTHSKEKPSLYLIRPDRLSEYDWHRNEWAQPSELPIERSLDTVEKSRDTFAVFIFWDLASRLDDRDGHATVRCFIPNIFLSPKTTRKFFVFLEPLGTSYPNLISPYLINAIEPYPSKEEFMPMIKREIAGKILPDNSVGNDIASALLGLTYTAAQQSLRHTLDHHKEIPDIIDSLNRGKEETLAKDLCMSILKPTSDDIPYGLDFLMDDLKIHRHLMCVPGQKREKGWLLIGTPGSGKSLLAKYLGLQLGYPAISFNISSIVDSFLGKTEKNMHNFCEVLEIFAPCVLYIDEFEKALASGGGENDGGTMMRAMGILFTWLNDTNAPIFMLGSANNLNPENGLALTRKGRFSQIYWVGEPCKKARYDICKANFERDGLKVSDSLLEELAAITTYFSGADLAWLCHEAIIKSTYYGCGMDSAQFRQQVLDLVEENRHRVHTAKSQYDGLRAWAAAYCKPSGLPPEK